MDDLKTSNIEASNIIIIEDKIKEISKISANISENVIIFMIRPQIEILNSVINTGLILNSIKPNIKKYLVFIPGENQDIIEHMIANYVINSFSIESLNYDLIPIDIDLLSLERDNTLKEMYIEKNLSVIDDFAYAFAKFENCFGKVKYKYIKGDLANNFCKTVEEKENEMGLNNSEEILGMIVLDRSVDFLTLMCSNYTLEGLLDENFGINLGKIKVKESLLKEGLSKTPIKSDKLIPYGITTKNNKFYCSFRCMHYLDVSRYVIIIKEYYKKLTNDNKKNGEKLSMSHLEELTKELNEFVEIKDKIIILENLINYLIKSKENNLYLNYIEKEQLMLAGDLPHNLYNYYEEHLYEQRDIKSLIKLMVIESLTQNGIKDYQKLKREILNIYGYQYIFLLRDLEQIGWLKEKVFLTNIFNLRKNITELTHIQINEKFNLVNLNYDSKNIQDCSYVFGGYCPLSLRLIETALEGKWNKLNDTIKKIPGYLAYPQNEDVITNLEKDTNIILIVFVGGITFTEIEGIRYLNRKFKEEYINKKRDKKLQFVIITTGILNTKKIFENFGNIGKPSFTMKQFRDCIKSKF